MNKNENLFLLEQTNQLVVLMTKIRDKSSNGNTFIFYADRVIRLLIEESLKLLPTVEKRVITSTNEEFIGRDFVGKICAVSIVRAGESMEVAVRQVCQRISIGKILIQRDETTTKPIYFYQKLPQDIKNRYVLLLDPMLATGGSACKAIELLINNKVSEDKIIFINLVCCPEGIRAVFENYPKIKIVTAAIDEKLNENAYILPGLGDFGDRYFRTF